MLFLTLNVRALLHVEPAGIDRTPPSAASLGDFAKLILRLVLVRSSVTFRLFVSSNKAEGLLLAVLQPPWALRYTLDPNINPEGTDVRQINLQSSNMSLFWGLNCSSVLLVQESSR